MAYVPDAVASGLMGGAVSDERSAPTSSDVRDFWILLKPNVMKLVVFTGWVGLFLAPGQLHPVLGVHGDPVHRSGGRRGRRRSTTGSMRTSIG